MDKNLLREVLIAPVVSEKSYSLLDENKYTFVVKKDANKTQIRQAVEELFNVKVLSVNTLNRKGKTYRTRFGEGSRSDTKEQSYPLRKAIELTSSMRQVLKGS